MLQDSYIDKVENAQALKQRVTQLYLFNQLLDAPPCPQTQVPFVLKPSFQIHGECLLGMYYRVFGDNIHNLPAWKDTMILQETPFPCELHFKQQLQFDQAK